MVLEVVELQSVLFLGCNNFGDPINPFLYNQKNLVTISTQLFTRTYMSLYIHVHVIT